MTTNIHSRRTFSWISTGTWAMALALSGGLAWKALNATASALHPETRSAATCHGDPRTPPLCFSGICPEGVVLPAPSNSGPWLHKRNARLIQQAGSLFRFSLGISEVHAQFGLIAMPVPRGRNSHFAAIESNPATRKSGVSPSPEPLDPPKKRKAGFLAAAGLVILSLLVLAAGLALLRAFRQR